MSWAYNQIDVRISQLENVLGDTDPEASTWEALSRYSIVRGRPTITPSSIEANQLSIPGRMGKPYSLISGRSNATLQFELLVANAWPFEELKLIPELDNVEKRAEYLKAKLMYAKRICYREPGRPYSWFFEIYRTDITEQDADEDVSILQIKMEVFPFKFDFSGNEGITVNNGSSYTFTNATMYPCNPVFVIETNNTIPAAPNNRMVISGLNGNANVWSNYIELQKRSDADNNVYPKMVIDTERLLVYGTNASQSAITSFTKYTKGNIDNLRVPKTESGITSIRFYNNSSNRVTVYPRSGKIV